MEMQKIPNSQSNPEKEKWSWRNQAPQLQTIPQSYSNQDSMVLAQKQKYRSMVKESKVFMSKVQLMIKNWKMLGSNFSFSKARRKACHSEKVRVKYGSKQTLELLSLKEV